MDVHLPRAPGDFVNGAVGLYVDVVAFQLCAKYCQKTRVTCARTKRTLAVNFLFRLHSFHKPVHADPLWISCIETGDVAQGVLFRLLRRMGTTAPQETRKAFIGLVGTHFLEDLVDFRKDIASRESTLFKAPVVALYLGDRDAAFLKKIPDFGWASMDEFRP